MTRLTVFGAPRIFRGDTEIAMPVRKTLALFAFLALEGRSPRARLAAMFWGDPDEPTARRNLRRLMLRPRPVPQRDPVWPVT